MINRIIGFAGSLSRPSRTRALVDTAVARAASRFGLTGGVFDLGDLGPSLGASAALADLAPDAREAVDAILEADALVVASPVYKGSYSGLFKHLFDLLEPEVLAGKPVLLGATGGGARHALVVEHQLRPLFGFFEAQTLATGLYASHADFAEGRLVSDLALERLDRAIEQFAPFLSPMPIALPIAPERRVANGAPRS